MNEEYDSFHHLRSDIATKNLPQTHKKFFFLIFRILGFQNCWGGTVDPYLHFTGKKTELEAKGG